MKEEIMTVLIVGMIIGGIVFSIFLGFNYVENRPTYINCIAKCDNVFQTTLNGVIYPDVLEQENNCMKACEEFISCNDYTNSDKNWEKKIDDTINAITYE